MLKIFLSMLSLLPLSIVSTPVTPRISLTLKTTAPQSQLQPNNSNCFDATKFDFISIKVSFNDSRPDPFIVFGVSVEIMNPECTAVKEIVKLGHRNLTISDQSSIVQISLVNLNAQQRKSVHRFAILDIATPNNEAASITGRILIGSNIKVAKYIHPLSSSVPVPVTSNYRDLEESYKELSTPSIQDVTSILLDTMSISTEFNSPNDQLSNDYNDSIVEKTSELIAQDNKNSNNLSGSFTSILNTTLKKNKPYSRAKSI